MQMMREMARKIRLVGSNWRKGTRGLQTKVKMGEKRNRGMDFCPRYIIRRRGLSPI